MQKQRRKKTRRDQKRNVSAKENTAGVTLIHQTSKHAWCAALEVFAGTDLLFAKETTAPTHYVPTTIHTKMLINITAMDAKRNTLGSTGMAPVIERGYNARLRRNGKSVRIVHSTAQIILEILSAMNAFNGQTECSCKCKTKKGWYFAMPVSSMKIMKSDIDRIKRDISTIAVMNDKITAI